MGIRLWTPSTSGSEEQGLKKFQAQEPREDSAGAAAATEYLRVGRSPGLDRSLRCQAARARAHFRADSRLSRVGAVISATENSTTPAGDERGLAIRTPSRRSS